MWAFNPISISFSLQGINRIPCLARKVYHGRPLLLFLKQFPQKRSSSFTAGIVLSFRHRGRDLALGHPFLPSLPMVFFCFTQGCVCVDNCFSLPSHFSVVTYKFLIKLMESFISSALRVYYMSPYLISSLLTCQEPRGPKWWLLSPMNPPLIHISASCRN